MKELRNVYCSAPVIRHVATQLAAITPLINAEAFSVAVTHNFETLSIMQRITRITDIYAAHFTDDYQAGLAPLYELLHHAKPAFVYMFMPDYVARYGQEHHSLSLKALGDFTPLSTSEMGIRPYLEDNFEACYPWLQKWAHDTNDHRRRLASEGTRPRLPWATRLHNIEADPSLCWPILHELRADSSLYVRKSVANHLNDISKNHAPWLFDHLAQWDRSNKQTAWIIKRGLRTLLKADNRQALALFGFDASALHVTQFKLSSTKVTPQRPLSFSFRLRADVKRKVAIHYPIYYQKKSGAMRPKVFKLAETTLDAGEERRWQKSHSFAPLSTRKHYEGPHKIEIVVNGKSFAQRSFTFSFDEG